VSFLQVSRSSYLSLPDDPGIYLFLDKDKTVLYVGKAKNLKNRVSSYFSKGADLGEKTKILVSKVAIIEYLSVASEIEALLLEASFIKKYAPHYNIRLTDGKSYPLIRITYGAIYPAVLIARRPDDPTSLYFGPFPNASAMKLVLKTIRRIFPFQSTENHSKTFCLYYHLHLCPCATVVATPESQKDYKKTIQKIALFLEGNVAKVVKELEKERDTYSKGEDFEKASSIQAKINAIRLITHPIHTPFEYETNPNLKTDIRKKELEELQTHLQAVNVITKPLERIECYDISNTSGTHATGSLVVFSYGEKDSKWYRRFKIKPETKGPNDFAMMYEVLTRRLKHTEWPYPQLFIVDGGKGQISSAQKALDEANVTIPLVGLAKREEIIITSDFRQIILPKKSKALQLVMRIRDEAHRFAITYHKKLRSQFTFE
jgi:excinuclease ABC subunit C